MQARGREPGRQQTSERGARVVVEHVSKGFEDGRIVALRDVSFRLASGEFVALTGPSGCGKSTLLNLIGTLDQPDSGTIVVDGKSLAELRDLADYRAAMIGFVFQLHHLFPTLTAIENVQVPMLGYRRLHHLFPTLTAIENVQVPMLGYRRRRERGERARQLLAEVGLGHRLQAYPATLSGGERQRVAIARALANAPRLLLADEPTGALDSATGAQVLALLQRLRAERGLTILMVTNDERAAQVADRRLRLRDGHLLPS